MSYNGDATPFANPPFRSHNWFEFQELKPRKNGAIELVWDSQSTVVSYIYVYEPETVMEEGIRQILIWENAVHPDYSGSYHFRPPVGWINDPSGFTKDNEGNYHLMYQHYPSLNQWYCIWG